MPIRAEDRWLYPIDWRQISEAIRFGRAKARCEQCGRPHMSHVAHLGDGRWWDSPARCWRNDRGRHEAVKEVVFAAVRTTYVVLACAHLNHDPGDSTPGNLRALCQRCHIIHDAAEHRWRRWWNVFRLCALRDLYEDPRFAHERLDSAPVVEVASLHLGTRKVGKRSQHTRHLKRLENNLDGRLFDDEAHGVGAGLVEGHGCVDVHQS
jgi:hypothetical protein